MIRWVLLPTIVLSAGLLVVSNVVLQTETVRGWFERKLESKTGLDWTIGSLSWTPWTGIQVGEVQAEFRGGPAEGADPLCRAGEIDVQIYWRALLKGTLSIRAMHLTGGRLAVPLELMALFPAPENRPGAPEQKGDPDPAVDSKPPEPDQATSSEKKPELAGNENEKPSARKPPSRPRKALSVKLLLKGCEVSVYSLSRPKSRRLVLRGLEAEIPLAGEDAEGWVSAEALTLADEQIAGPFRSRLDWKQPLLAVPATRFDWAGLAIEAGGSLLVRRVPVCNAQVRILPGALERTALAGLPGLELEAGKAEMVSRFNGNLFEVRSWRGDAVMRVQDVRVVQKERREAVAFEVGRVTAVMRGGSVQVSEARLSSERLSFLGNGVALSDGQVFGVMRVVADQEYAEAITKVAIGSFVAGGWTRSWLVPLVTADRYYRDIHVQGTMSKAMVDVGRKGEELEVNRAWEQMAAFVKHEADETRRGVPPSPVRDAFFPPR